MPTDPAHALLPPPPVHLLDGASLFIDFDGTLVDLVARPDLVVVDEVLRDLLSSLAKLLQGRLAIVTGRSIEQMDAFLGDLARTITVAGSHGVEWRTADGKLHTPTELPDIEPALEALRQFAASRSGTIVEHKRYGIALHYRLAPHVEEEARAVVQRLANEFGFGTQMGKMMAEMKIVGGDKGQAVATLRAEPSMAASTPWFIGDDITDEAGFAMAKDLGGGGIFVGVPRETAATYRLADVASVRAWLTEAITRLA
jgi:trehalose 6-phosphate phosphatase